MARTPVRQVEPETELPLPSQVFAHPAFHFGRTPFTHKSHIVEVPDAGLPALVRWFPYNGYTAKMTAAVVGSVLNRDAINDLSRLHADHMQKLQAAAIATVAFRSEVCYMNTADYTGYAWAATVERVNDRALLEHTPAADTLKARQLTYLISCATFVLSDIWFLSQYGLYLREEQGNTQIRTVEEARLHDIEPRFTTVSAHYGSAY